MDYFHLSLSSTDNTFSAGQTVEGTVRVGLSQPTAVNAIIVCLTGRVNTSFQKRKCESWLTAFRTYLASDGRLVVSYHNELVRYTAALDCFKMSVNVLDAKTVDNLLVDQHEFPFSFQLPSDLPPSFEGEHGSITYVCEAVLYRTEWYKADIVTENKITILPTFVASPKDSIPLKQHFGNEGGWSFFVHGRISATAMLPASSFSVGELVPISLDIRNDSSQAVKRIELTLVERHYFVGSRASIQLCNNEGCCGCYRGGHKKTVAIEKVLVWLGEELAVGPYTSTTLLRTLTLPQSVVQSFGNCPIVQLRYYIKISLIPNTWIGSNTTTEVPIRIRSQTVNQLLTTTEKSVQTGAREPTAPLGTEGFANENSLYPKGVCLYIAVASPSQ